MNFLQNLTPMQRTALYIGVPLVALAVLVSSRRSAAAPEPDPNSTAAADPPAGTLPGYAAGTDPGNTGIIDAGSFASYIEDFTGELTNITRRITDLETSPTSTVTKEPPGTIHFYAVAAGDTAASVATKLRAAGAKTADGRAITSDYLIRFNQLRTRPNGPYIASTAKLWPGMSLRY